MGIQRLNAVNPFAGKIPKIADLNVSATTSTWYTLVDITGKGVVKRISGNNQTSINQYLDIQLTIDGTVHLMDVTAIHTTRGLGGDSTYGRSTFFDVITDIEFKSSLKIELRQTTGTTGTLSGSVDYVLV